MLMRYPIKWFVSLPCFQVSQVSWDPIGTSLATASFDGEVKVWKQSITGEWIGDVIPTAMQ